MLWLLQHFGVSNSMQVSHPQLSEMASLGLHSGISLTYAWSQQFFLVIKANSIASFFYLNSKVKNRMAETAKFCCRQQEDFRATGSSLSTRNLKAHTQSDTHLPTRPCLCQQSHTSKWCHFLRATFFQTTTLFKFLSMAITKETEIKSAARCCCFRGLNVNQRKDKNNVHY